MIPFEAMQIIQIPEHLVPHLGHNKELLDTCRILWEYAYFIDAVRENQLKDYPFEEAVIDAIGVCIEQGIVKEILERNRDFIEEFELALQ